MPATCLHTNGCDWSDPHTGALYRPLVPHQTPPSLEPIALPTVGDWRLTLSLPDADGRKHDLVIQHHAGVHSLGAARRPYCCPCRLQIDQAAIRGQHLILLHQGRRVASFTVDHCGRPVTGVESEASSLECNLLPAAARPAATRALTFALDLDAPTALAAWREETRRRENELETLPAGLLTEGAQP